MAPYCRHCERDFNNTHDHGKHMRMRHGEDPYAPKPRYAEYCRDCDMGFGVGGLLSHYANSPNHHWCIFCRLDFVSSFALRDHNDEEHPACATCRLRFRTEAGLHEHRRQSHASTYCIDCRRIFSAPSQYQAHRGSSLHTSADVACPLRGCGRSFVSVSALVLHMEAGTCASGITRRMIDDLVRHTPATHLTLKITRLDRGNVITNPNRMIAGGTGMSPSQSTRVYATEQSYDSYEDRYICPLCPRQFLALDHLNQHLGSTRHASIEVNSSSGKLYRCPGSCRRQMTTLSALVQHIERRENRDGGRIVRPALDQLVSATRRIAL